MRGILLAGAALGFLAVVVGALAGHALQPHVSPDVWRQITTAMAYHRFGAITTTALGLAILAVHEPRLLRCLVAGGWLFTAGTLLFSFSIYLRALLDAPALTAVTPVGGTLLIIAWAPLAWAGVLELRARPASG